MLLPLFTNETNYTLLIIYCLGRMYCIAYFEITCGTDGVIWLFWYYKICAVLILAVSVIRAQRNVLCLQPPLQSFELFLVTNAYAFCFVTI